jgi:DNA-directed RNA polymerase specialized sigma24 family protein
MENTGFCDLVSPFYVGEDRLLEIESSLAACTAKISGYHDASGIRYRLDFYREFLRVHRDGHSCIVGEAKIPARDARAMITLKEVEGELLGQFSKMIKSVTCRIASRHGMDGGDLTSEAYEAFFRAMLNYNGSTRFSTFLQNCLKKNLARARAGDSLVRVPREIRRLSMRVVGLMNSGSTFDEATSGLSKEETKEVIAGMRRVQGAGDLQMDESELAAVEDGEKLGWVNTALQGVQFTRLEREALRGFMESPAGVMGLSSNLKDLVNPDTGRPYSRAAVSAAWAQARKKIRLALEAA